MADEQVKLPEFSTIAALREQAQQLELPPDTNTLDFKWTGNAISINAIEAGITGSSGMVFKASAINRQAKIYRIERKKY